LTTGVMLFAADVRLRPARIEDAAFVADLYTAVTPDDPQDPVQYEDRWRNPDVHVRRERFIGELDGERVAYGEHRHATWERMPKRYGSVAGDLLPSHRTAERVDALIAVMEERSRGDGTRTFSSWTHENDSLIVGVLTGRGYREERRQRFWELDLVANRVKLERMAEESRAKMREQRIRVLTIDEDEDPEKWRKLFEMSTEAEMDIPTTVPHVPAPFEDFMRWMNSPGVVHDRVWIATEGDRILGVSMLNYPPKRGVVQTDWTGVARAGRGRGVARALKCETVMQAIALGVPKVRTDNDSQNAPILHINETMGYRRRPDMIQFMRPA
jgi:GNAT superfamily N-acetyltransferase